MPYLRLFSPILFCFCMLPAQAQGQHEDNYIETIYIVTERDTEPDTQPDTLAVSESLSKGMLKARSLAVSLSHSAKNNRPHEEFYRVKSVLRMDLHTPANRSLRYAEPQEGVFEGQSGPVNAMGVINLLLEGLKRGDISAYGPLGQAGYTFDSLRRDLMILEGMDPSQGRNMGLDEIGGESLSGHLDMLGNRRMNTGGQESFDIRFFRLIWHNPNTSRGAHALAMFPYEDVKPLLEQMTMEMRQHSGFSMQVNKFFEGRMYMATPVDIPRDSLRYLHVLPPRMEAVPLKQQLKPADLSKKD